MKREIFLGAAIICTLSLAACGKADDMQQAQQIQGTEDGNIKEEQPDDSIGEELPTPAPADAQKETSPPSEAEDMEVNEANEENAVSTPEANQDEPKIYLADYDIHPLYAAFLRNEITVKNPFVPDDPRYNTELSFFDDREYEEEQTFDECSKVFALVDVDNDDVPELIFKISQGTSELMYILGIQDDVLVCYDIHETHTGKITFGIYDNGIVWWSYEETIYYTFDDNGKVRELIHFFWEEGCYYLEGNEEARVIPQSYEEYESLVSAYEGEEPEWFGCDIFADIPQNE